MAHFCPESLPYPYKESNPENEAETDEAGGFDLEFTELCLEPTGE
jgi:hypothetical protein